MQSVEPGQQRRQSRLAVQAFQQGDGFAVERVARKLIPVETQFEAQVAQLAQREAFDHLVADGAQTLGWDRPLLLHADAS